MPNPSHSTTRVRIRDAGTIIVMSFAVLIMIGAALLALPISHRAGVNVDISSAIFTAASAVTVTGLTVVDTQTVWSPFGELVLLSLIQIGGFGILTLAAFVAVAVGRRLGLRTGLTARAEIGVNQQGDVRRLIMRIGRFVIISESVAAALLTIGFLRDDEHGLRSAIHLGVFHAVSAFNNAGFSVLDGGLERYADDWYMSLIIAFTFILGGLGFPVVFDIAGNLFKPQRWTLHTKVTATASAALLVGGTALITATEWNNGVFSELGVGEKVLTGFFQSATARTAGFNTVPIAGLRPATLLVLILLMVIGAGSASTGGGIKVSTWALVLRSTISEFRRDPTTTVWARTIPLEVQRQALALVIAALGTIGTATFLLSLVHSELSVTDLLFEAASAFGTVGLSVGITDQLSTLGRAVVIALMFIGRVGPITFGTAVLFRSTRPRYAYPEGSLLVG